jgi:transcriptional regulator with XRE-family HTH domain
LPNEVARLLKKYLNLAQEQDIEVRTLAQQSKFLGISSGSLSQLRNAKSKLSPEVIEKIASAVASTGIAEKDEVKNEFSQASEAKAESKPAQSISGDDLWKAVWEFFKRVSNRESLVCVDYRDFPQTSKDGPYPDLANAAAAAVADGCCFAMFQPFGTVRELEEKLIKAVKEHQPPEGYTYLLGLARKVREVYGEIKAAAEERLRAVGREEECQIALYEARVALPIAACGISSRMLYASYVEGKPPRRHERVYQWVAGARDLDYFIERDKTSVGLEAIAQQFNPITLCWSPEKGLPRTNVDLETEFKNCKLDEELMWKVWEGKE